LIFCQCETPKLLIEAIRYGDLPETRAKLEQIVSNRLNRDHLNELLSDNVLARNAMDLTKIQGIRQEMERAEARKLQPHFIGSFFMEAFSKEFTQGDDSNVYYLRQPFQKEPDFGVTSVNYNLKELKERSQKPC
jgi:hypothetical protein